MLTLSLLYAYAFNKKLLKTNSLRLKVKLVKYLSNRESCYGLKVLNRIDVQNDPVNFIDPEGLEIRVYSSDAFGIKGLNHAFVYSTESKDGIGTAGSSVGPQGNGIGDLNSPYLVAKLPAGMSEKEFIKRIKAAKGWNNGVWTPKANDCHSDLESAFEQAGVDYPGAPNGRIDADDSIKSGINNALREGYYRILHKLSAVAVHTRKVNILKSDAMYSTQIIYCTGSTIKQLLVSFKIVFKSRLCTLNVIINEY